MKKNAIKIILFKVLKIILLFITKIFSLSFNIHRMNKFNESISKGGYKKYENGSDIFQNNTNSYANNDMFIDHEDNLDCPNINYPKI